MFEYYGMYDQPQPAARPQPQQQQPQQQINPAQMAGMIKNFQKGGGMEGLGEMFGGGGEVMAGTGDVATTGGSQAGGLGAAGIGAIVAAAIAAQHGLSEDTNTEFEGVETADAFEGQFGTEPWMGWMHDKLDLSPTAGEKFDAAVKNEDWKTAFERSFEMSDYWADPGSSWAETTAAGLGVDEGVAGWAFNPIGEVLGGLS